MSPEEEERLREQARALVAEFPPAHPDDLAWLRQVLAPYATPVQARPAAIAEVAPTTAEAAVTEPGLGPKPRYGQRVDADETFYTWLGRIVAAVAYLEYMTAYLAAVVNDQDQTELDAAARRWTRTEKGMGQAIAALDEAGRTEDAARLRSFLATAKGWREERHALAHSFVVFQVEEGWSEEPPTALHYHPDTLAARPLPSAHDLKILHRNVQAAIARAIKLAGEVAPVTRRE